MGGGGIEIFDGTGWDGMGWDRMGEWASQCACVCVCVRVVFGFQGRVRQMS